MHIVHKIDYNKKTDSNVVIIQDKYLCGSLRDELHDGVSGDRPCEGPKLVYQINNTFPIIYTVIIVYGYNHTLHIMWSTVVIHT